MMAAIAASMARGGGGGGAESDGDLAMKQFTRTIGASPDTPKTAFAEINAAHQAKTIMNPQIGEKKENPR